MAITEAQALIVVSLSIMKLELRIPSTESSHDLLLTSQIVQAVSHVSRRTGATGDALLPLRAAAVAIVRAALQRAARGHAKRGAQCLDAAFRIV